MKENPRASGSLRSAYAKTVGRAGDGRGGSIKTMAEVVGGRGVYIPFIVKHPRLSPFFGRPYNQEDAKFDGYTGSGSGVGAGKGTLIFRTADLTWAAYNKYGMESLSRAKKRGKLGGQG